MSLEYFFDVSMIEVNIYSFDSDSLLGQDSFCNLSIEKKMFATRQRRRSPVTQPPGEVMLWYGLPRIGSLLSNF